MALQTDPQILNRATQISSEVIPAANTKTRVGSLLFDMWETLVSRLASKANTADVTNALNQKANTVDVNAALTEKADATALTAETSFRLAADVNLQEQIDALSAVSYTFENGLTENSGVVSLGGTIDTTEFLLDYGEGIFFKNMYNTTDFSYINFNEIYFSGAGSQSYLTTDAISIMNDYYTNNIVFGVYGESENITSIYAVGKTFYLDNSMDSGNLVTDTWVDNLPILRDGPLMSDVLIDGNYSVQFGAYDPLSDFQVYTNGIISLTSGLSRIELQPNSTDISVYGGFECRHNNELVFGISSNGYGVDMMYFPGILGTLYQTNGYGSFEVDNLLMRRNALAPIAIATADFQTCELYAGYYPDPIGDTCNVSLLTNLRWAVPHTVSGERYEYLAIPNQTKAAPPTDSSNFILYVDSSGNLKVKGPSGTVTTLAVA